MQYNLKLNLFTFLLLLILSLQCQKTFEMPERIINPPINVITYPTNQGIIVKFYGNNIEEGFSGYNVYVSDKSGIKNQSISPIKNNYGGLPTLPYGAYGCYPDASQQSFVTVKTDSFNSPISNGKKYYVTVTAYILVNDKEYESDHSNESEIIPLNEGEAEIFNHKISGKTNDGIVFNSNKTVIITNAPDTIVSGWGGDFVFELNDFNGEILPCIVIKSNQTYIQDLGYYNNINEVDEIPQSGYLAPDIIMPVIESHLYILYKPAFNQYIRIYVISAPQSQSSDLSDVSLKIKWAF